MNITDSGQKSLISWVALIRVISLQVVIGLLASNNEFILQFILCKIKMADFKRRQLEIGLEFVR